MRIRVLGLVAAVAALLAPAALLATDAPHDYSQQPNLSDCSGCHTLHGATGGTLVGNKYTCSPPNCYSTNDDACLACHNGESALVKNWSGNEATPGTGGSLHRWNTSAVNTTYGATLPTNTDMLARVKNGNLQCAVCHNPHNSNSSYVTSSSVHLAISPLSTTPTFAFNTYADRTGPVSSGTAQMQVIQPTSNPASKGYRVKITSFTSTSVTFQISHNAGLTSPTWYDCTGVTLNGTCSVNYDTQKALDDPAIKIQFTKNAGPAQNDYWDFYVSYPRLRATNVANAMCLDCHSSRNQTYPTVEGPGDGTKVFSHPVGQALNANGKLYDQSAPLDANGASQTTGDGNAANDLKTEFVGANNVVLCTTCHAPHNASSNSLSQDLRP